MQREMFQVGSGLLLIALTGCAASRTEAKPPSTASPELEALADRMQELTNRIRHLETEVELLKPETEIRQLGVDKVRWRNAGNTNAGESEIMLECHLASVRETKEILQFLYAADPMFYLDADGCPTVEVTAWNSGVLNESQGTSRFVMLRGGSSASIKEGTTYRLRARNDNQKYKWLVADGLIVTGRSDQTSK